MCSLGSDLQSDSFIVRLMMDGEFVNVDLSVLYLNMHQYFCHVVQNCSHSEHVKHGSLLGGCTLPGFQVSCVQDFPAGVAGLLVLTLNSFKVQVR